MSISKTGIGGWEWDTVNFPYYIKQNPEPSWQKSYVPLTGAWCDQDNLCHLNATWGQVEQQLGKTVLRSILALKAPHLLNAGMNLGSCCHLGRKVGNPTAAEGGRAEGGTVRVCLPRAGRLFGGDPAPGQALTVI